MNFPTTNVSFIDLAAGAPMPANGEPAVWRVLSGAVCLLHGGEEGKAASYPLLALSGDLIGIERLAGQELPDKVFAVMRCRLQAVAWNDAASMISLLSNGLLQSRRQYAEMVQLRSGAVSERVKLLLLLLLGEQADSDADVLDLELPPLRQWSLLVDAAPETVCRVFGSLRRLDLMDDGRHLAGTRIRRDALSRLGAVPGMTSSKPAFRPGSVCRLRAG